MTGSFFNNADRKSMALEIKDVRPSGEFTGYASLFDKLDLGKDKIAKGAFSRSLNTRGPSGIRMLFQHDPTDPIGTWLEIREDQRGLFVRGKIAAETSRGGEIVKLLHAGAIDGLSIGFKTKSSSTDRKSGVRTVHEADLWEISIVTFPMLPQARITEVKNGQSRTLPSIREFENWLKQDAGLTRSQARCVIAKGYAQLAGKRDAAGDVLPLVQTMRRAAETISRTNKQ